MADITMCLNIKCGRRGSCLRYMAYPNDYSQSYNNFTELECEHYWQTHQYEEESIKDVDENNEKMYNDFADY